MMNQMRTCYPMIHLIQQRGRCKCKKNSRNKSTFTGQKRCL